MELLNNITDEAMKSYASLPVQRRLQLAAIMERLRQLAVAVDYYSETLEMLSGTRDISTLVVCLEGLGRTQRAQGQMKDAREHLLQAVKLSQERNDATVEERLYHHLGQLDEEDGHLHAAQSWYRKAESLARKSENWGGVFAALTYLSSLAMKLQQPEEREMWEAECFQLFYEYGEVVYAGPTPHSRPQVITQARDLLFPEGLDIPDSISETSSKGILEQARNLRMNKKYQESISLYLSALVRYIQMDQPEIIASCLNGLGLIYQALIQEALLAVRKTLILEAMEQVEGDLEVEDVEQFRKYITNETNLELLVQVQYKLCGLDTNRLYRLICSYVGDLAKKAIACHQWVLELCKEMDELEEQASQISNLGIVEKNLGNLDTAHRYQLWAAQVHRKAGVLKHAAIDLIDLANIEECLGDVETGSAKRRQAQELLNAR